MQRLTKKEVKALKHEERVHEEEKAAQKKRLKDYAFWVGFIVLLLLCVGTIFYFARPKPTPIAQVAGDATTSLPPVSSSDYIRGPKEAQITLIEYGDFQCPGCAHYYPMVKELEKDFSTSLRVIFRNTPIPSLHKNALLAALAAYAAGKQGKFWEMHDLLYENQTTWAELTNADKTFTGYAAQLKLDIDRFTTDMTSKEALAFVTAQTRGGTKAGVQGTPTFFLNGHKMENPLDYKQFKATVQQELK